MKKKVLTILMLLIVFVTFSQTQTLPQQLIRIGVKSNIGDPTTEKLISEHNYNFVDAFEYEMAILLKKYIEKSDTYTVEFVTVEQNEKLQAIQNGENIDALLFTFSNTKQRRDNGIHFSIPYFSNKAIGIITNNENLDIRSLKNTQMRIGTVGGKTIPEIELESLKNKKYPDNLIINKFSNHQELIEALRANEIDAAAGDVSRLIFDVNEGDFHFGGNLPTKRSKIRDSYSIGITQSKANLKPFFDRFIISHRNEIILLKEKWLSTAIEDAYESYYNKEEDKLMSYIWLIVIGAIAIILVLLIIFSYSTKRLKKQLEKQKAKNHDEKLSEIFSIYDKKGRANVDAEGIAEIGINFFKNAKKITYVGSGGFLSDAELGPKWSRALYDYLEKQNTVLERVVDFPGMCVNTENEICFDETDNFLSQKLERQYIYRYLKWICIQYHCLLHYEDLKIINSRGAALWGYGIVIMIKDDNEVLFFTTNKNTKIGSSIQDKILASQIYKVISDIIDIGVTVNIHKFEEMFFRQDRRLIELKNKIDNSNQKKLSPEILKEIEKTCKQIAGI